MAADYIAAHFKDAKIAVLDDNSTYGKGIADQVRANLGKLGVPIAYNTSYTAGDKDYSALMSRLKQQGITLVYLGGYYSDTGLIMREGAAQGFTPQYFSEDAAVTSALGKSPAPGRSTLMTFPASGKDPAAAKAVAELTKLHEDPPGMCCIRTRPSRSGRSRQARGYHLPQRGRQNPEARRPVADRARPLELRLQGRRGQRRLRHLEMA